jgi:hypothetical protein
LPPAQQAAPLEALAFILQPSSPAKLATAAIRKIVINAKTSLLFTSPPVDALSFFIDNPLDLDIRLPSAK